jgi:hypothetical protein
MKEAWTYEVPAAGSDASGLEDYQVETSDAQPAGKVVAVLERDGERFLAFDAGTPPLARTRRAVRWEDIEDVDHDTLTVRVRFAERELGRVPELDPGKAVEDGEAEAVRVTRLPRGMTPTAEAGARGPSDRGSYATGLLLFGGALVTLLALFVAAAATDFTWEFALFAVPAALMLASAVVAYRTFRQPYER